MVLLIRDIPKDGQNFEWNENKTHVKGFIYPIQGGFDLSGHISSKVPMDCSFCTNLIDIPVEENFHEIIFLGAPKTGTTKEEEEVQKDDLEVFYVDGPELHLLPIIQQVIDVSLPIQPKCVQKGAPKGYPECIADWDYEKFSHNGEEKLHNNPFEVLKNLKKNESS